MLQLHFAMDNLFGVPPEAFDPPPKVESAVVRMRPLSAALPAGFDAAVFASLVAAAFGQRRKTLRNSLGSLLNARRGANAADRAGDKGAGDKGAGDNGPGNNAAALLEKTGIDPGLRAENLGVADYIRLSLTLSASPSPA
jgi:16S rRNA A1518/A1519 N6-dimethyltransferase RsmA/KsgA/DIM1 with predicted DNA glycosylase/AP lyase activity